MAATNVKVWLPGVPGCASDYVAQLSRTLTSGKRYLYSDISSSSFASYVVVQEIYTIDQRTGIQHYSTTCSDYISLPDYGPAVKLHKSTAHYLQSVLQPTPDAARRTRGYSGIPRGLGNLTQKLVSSNLTLLIRNLGNQPSLAMDPLHEFSSNLLDHAMSGS